jgi:hypothetical protein
MRKVLENPVLLDIPERSDLVVGGRVIEHTQPDVADELHAEQPSILHGHRQFRLLTLRGT